MSGNGTRRIAVQYVAVDGYRKTAKFTTLSGARKFAWRYVGKDAEIGMWYAVSTDGVGRVTVSGVSLYELFDRKPVVPERG